MAFSMGLQELLEAGAHYGHQKSRWNPRMRPFIYDERNGVHVINLALTLSYAEEAYNKIVRTVAEGQGVLFVGTKPQARDVVKAEAGRSNQFFMVYRWLGGTLTNFRTIRKSIDKITKYQAMEDEGVLQQMTKKEALSVVRERDKLLMNLEGIMEMKRLPGIVFVVDIAQDSLAVEEANKLGIPVVALCDSNTDPSNVDFPIPANDDAVRSIRLFAGLVADAAIDGEALRQESLRADEEEAVKSESLADQFIGAEEEDDLLTMRKVIKKIRKEDGSIVEAAGEAMAEEAGVSIEEGKAAAEEAKKASDEQEAPDSDGEAEEAETKEAEAATEEAEEKKPAKKTKAKSSSKKADEKEADKPKKSTKKSTKKKSETKSKAKSKKKADDEDAEKDAGGEEE